MLSAVIVIKKRGTQSDDNNRFPLYYQLCGSCRCGDMYHMQLHHAHCAT
jgi:hypothetical protein